MNDSTPIFRSLEMIEERIREKLTVEGLASGVHFSKYHYQRMFREAVGDSVMGYVARRRIALAAGELAGTDSTVLEIALKYGYDSHEGFTRSFKAYTGVTPTDYRKYHSVIGSVSTEKERSAMKYSKTANEIVGELNSLIVQAKETAAYAGKGVNAAPGAEGIYDKVWDFAANRAEAAAGRLAGMLEGITVISRCPDEISARFLMIKTVEDVAFECSMAAFQTGLMMARALPQHQEASRELCRRFDALAKSARMKAGKIAASFKELAEMIFQEMREKGAEILGKTVEAGRQAAEELADPALPYGYIAEGVSEIAEEIAGKGTGGITLRFLEDCLLRLEAISFAVYMDVLRMPSSELVFQGIERFRRGLDQALEFFRSLPEDAAREGNGAARSQEARIDKTCRDLAFQESILLFYLKGEIRKLDGRLDGRRRAAFGRICDKLNRAVAAAGGNTDKYRVTEKRRSEATGLLREVYSEMMTEAELLGDCGGPIRYIAEEIICPVGRPGEQRA